MSLTTEFNTWIQSINDLEKPNPEIIAFNFGLLERNNGYTFYLVGSLKFDSEDDDWACIVDYEPKQKYLDFPLEAIKGKDWNQVLEVAENLLLNYMKSDEFEHSIFHKAVAITTGFDDGDLIRIK